MKYSLFGGNIFLRFSVLCFCLSVLALPAANVQAASTGFLYALNDNAAGNHVYGFAVNEGTGALTAIPGFPIATGGNGDGFTPSERVAIDRLNGRLYVVNSSSHTVSAFSINPANGALTAMFSPISLGAPAGTWFTVAVHPSGSPLVVGDNGGNLASFKITATTATAAAGNPFAMVSAKPFSAAFSQDGNYVYTGGDSANTAFFSVNASTGVLTLLGEPALGPASPLAYATDTAGRLFMADWSNTTVYAFTTSAGTPTTVTGNPFNISGLTSAYHGVLHPRGFYMVADNGSAPGQVGVYKISNSGTATTLTAVGVYASGGTGTATLALNQSGMFLFASNSTTRNLTTYQVLDASGVLTSPSTQAANTLGAAGGITGLAYMPPMVTLPAAGLLYVLNDNAAGNKIFGFAVNEANGALTLANGFPIATSGNGDGSNVPERMVLDRANGRLYAINAGSKTVSAFSINPTTGALTALPFSLFSLGTPAGSWVTVEVHPSGSPLVVGDGGGNLASFNITATAATAAAGSPFTTGSAKPFTTAFSQDGSFVYTSGSSNPIAGFSVNASTGVLTALTGSPFTLTGVNEPSGFSTDSMGRLFMANYGSANATLSAFTTSAGIPTAVTGNSFPSGITGSYHGVLHPQGFYMAADYNGSQVGVYQISGSGAATTLAAVGGSPFASSGLGTSILALNQSGTFLFTANSNSRNLTSFSVDTATGALATPVTQPPGTVLGSAGTLSGMVYVAQPATIAFTASGPLATPNPAGVGQTVSFSSGASGGFGTLTYTWAFGDGGTGTGANATHAYAAAGNFTATVTATDVLNVSTPATVAVAVLAPLVGTGPDTNGNGVSDSFEAATGFDPSQPITVGAVQKLSVLKTAIKLNFAKPGNDAIGLSGVLLIPDGFTVSGQKVYVDIGGVIESFTLGAKGVSPKGNNLFAVGVKASKGVVVLQVAKFAVKLMKGSFATALAADGLVNATTTASVTVPVTVIFNNTILQKNVTMSYKASAGKGGAAK